MVLRHTHTPHWSPWVMPEKTHNFEKLVNKDELDI